MLYSTLDWPIEVEVELLARLAVSMWRLQAAHVSSSEMHAPQVWFHCLSWRTSSLALSHALNYKAHHSTRHEEKKRLSRQSGSAAKLRHFRETSDLMAWKFGEKRSRG
jgi:hypothetical protein